MKLVKVISPVALVLLLATLILVTACGTQGPAGSQGEQGIQGEQGLPGPSMIVAMGTISQYGTILQGYNVGNVTHSANGMFGWHYEITLTGITYNTSDYITIITAGPSSAGTIGFYGGADNAIGCRFESSDGKLVVILFDCEGHTMFGLFSFVVLKVP